MQKPIYKSVFVILSAIVIFISTLVTSTRAQDSLLYSLCLDTTFRFSTFGGSDCWGWKSPGGVEYAIMGINAGVAFVNTQTRTVSDIVPGPAGGSCGFTQWRDIKTYAGYAYVTSECSGTNEGLMVIDMSFLPDSVHFVGSFAVNGVSAVTSHNLSIDSIQGYLYAEGNSSAATSIYIHSLANPEAPSYVGAFGISNGIHDIYAYDDTVYIAEGSSGRFAIWDLTNKGAPVLLARIAVPNPGYVHNIWPTADHQHCITTEETDFKTVKVWDISDLEDVSLVGEYLAPNGMAHNAQMKGDTIYLSHYESGVAVVDAGIASSPLELARYDSYPEGEGPPSFNGTWGCYPYASNGLVYGTNFDGRLFILQEEVSELVDTLYPGSVVNMGNGNVKVDFYAVNSFPLKRIVIPFSYAGPVTMFFIACSTNGTRAQGFTTSHTLGVDWNNKRAAWELVTTGAPMPPGSGVVLSAWFTVEEGNNGPYNQIAFIDNWINLKPRFVSDCADFRPRDLDFVEICCTGNRGNLNYDADNANIVDLTFLVDRVFQSGPPSICPDEADVNADSTPENILDLTYIVDFLFRGGSAPPPCN